MSASSVPAHFQRDRFTLTDEIARLRSESPVKYVTLPSGAKAWLVTRHEHVRYILSNPEIFGNDGRGTPHIMGDGSISVLSNTPARDGDLTTYDPPDHGRLRRMISTGFTARRIQLLQTWIEGIVADCLSVMEKDGPPADLVQSFALPIPSMVICELLGVPYADRDGFQRRSVTRFDGTLAMDVRTAAYDASLKYMAELVLRRRADPDESLLGTLVREYGDQIDDRELIGIGDLILLGGHETTANMLGLGTLFLLENPKYAEMVRNGENVEGIVEELLRYLSVVQIGVPRIAREDVILADQHIRRGDRLLCSFPSANHDDAKIPGASVFDPTRRAAHLAFGHGIHYCIGAPLARMEIKIALPALLNRFPGLRLDVEPEAVDFRPSSVFYGVRSLPLTW